MKRKFLIVLLAMTLAIVSAFALTACSKVSVELSFKVDGETFATVSTNGNETIAMPKDLEKAGYVFDGWYWDEGTWARPFTANSLLDTPLSSNMSVYAKFSEPHDHTFSTEWEHDETHHWHKATCGHASETKDKAEHTFNNARKCTVCGYVTDKLMSTDFRVTGFEERNDGYYLKVPNSTDKFSFLGKVIVADGATWRVFTDIDCTQEVPSRTKALTPGDNNFYILVTYGNEVNCYNLIVRRREIYTVSFETNDGTSVESQ